jgi:hypothetical protein
MHLKTIVTEERREEREERQGDIDFFTCSQAVFHLKVLFC